MSGPKINLPDELLAKTSAAPQVAGPVPSPEEEQMLRALESPRGLAIPCSSKRAAEAMRFRFYRRKNTIRKATGRDVYGSLIITIVEAIGGWELHLTKRTIGEAREL